MLALLLGAPALAGEPRPSPDDPPAPEAPAPATPEPAVPAAEVDTAIGRAVEILVAAQETLAEGEAAGEWPYEGVYREAGEIPIGYRVGGTAIVARALLEAPGWDGDQPRREAVARALRFIDSGLDHEHMGIGFRARYDVRGWGHTYALLFYLRALELDRLSKEDAARARARVDDLVHRLEQTEIPVTGGWNYSRPGGGNAPSPASTFMTAPTVQALLLAAARGAKVREDVLERAVKTLEDARLDTGAFQYGTSPGNRKGTGFEAVEGAIGRMPVCESTLLLLGRGSVDRVRSSLDAFFEHWQWLEQRRKQTGTHVPPFQIAPYYFFYAHTHAAQAIELLPEAERPGYREKLISLLWKVREESGGWNDRVFPRSESYGTAMTLLALLQPSIPLPPSVGKKKKERERAEL